MPPKEIIFAKLNENKKYCEKFVCMMRFVYSAQIKRNIYKRK